jgi:hypothetical protein
MFPGGAVFQWRWLKNDRRLSTFATRSGARTPTPDRALLVVVDVLSSQFLNKHKSSFQFQG